MKLNIDMNKFSNVLCPKCGAQLLQFGNSLKCADGHTYDIASQGYVNLLPPHKQGAVPGDSKEMVRTRRAFLENGYYAPLADKLCQIMQSISPALVADIGCGEGYYTGRVKSACSCSVIGIDISKFALMYAAKAYSDIDFCVASLHSLPLASGSCDAILCCFCAHDEEEFSRVLNDDGRFVIVTPGKRHLFELKSVLYDKPYENDPAESMKFFDLEYQDKLSFEINVPHDDIWNLFSMTPYFWKTPKQGSDRLKEIDTLCCTAEFDIRVYRKKR